MSNLCTLRLRNDIRQVAALAKFYKENSKPILSRNSLASMCLADYHDALLKAGLLTPIETLNEALEVLSSCGLTSLSASSTRNRAFLNALQKENLQLDNQGSTSSLAQKVVGGLTQGKGGTGKQKSKPSLLTEE